MISAAQPDHGRLLAKVLRDVLAAGPYACLADLTEALKTRCAKHRIRPTDEEITMAYRLVGSNTRLTLDTPRPQPSHQERYDQMRRPIGKQDTALILDRLRTKLGCTLPVKGF